MISFTILSYLIFKLNRYLNQTLIIEYKLYINIHIVVLGLTYDTYTYTYRYIYKYILKTTWFSYNNKIAFTKPNFHEWYFHTLLNLFN